MGESRVKAFKGEGLFLSAIQTVTEEESPKVYFLTGHGERDPEDFDQREGYSELARYIKRDNILVQKWNLLENQALPTDASAIVIAGPHQAFAPTELNALEQYLKGNGRLLILLDPHTQTGLEAFLKRWGVQVDDDLAMRQAGVLLGTQMLDVNAVAADYAAHPITAKLADTNTEFPYARSVRRSPQTEGGTPDQPRVTELAKAAPGVLGRDRSGHGACDLRPSDGHCGTAPAGGGGRDEQATRGGRGHRRHTPGGHRHFAVCGQ
jgi:hypothetical protein